MKCIFCKIGTTQPDKASFTVEQEEAFVVFTNVEADVCANCGEAYFSAETASQLY